MPKLLDFVKEKGLTHDDVMKMIEDSLIEEPEEEEAPEIEDGEEEKMELYITDMKNEETETSDEESDEEETSEEDEAIVITPEELEKKIEEEVAKKLAAKRKVPSKGKIVTTPQSDVPVVKRNWHEVIV